jgi:excinuclease ABC subunit A
MAEQNNSSTYLGRAIKIRGARQNNLKNLDLDIPTGELVVVTGVSGSGKSSLVFDTLYAEGQRRYVETFSPYARQFLDRMDRPQVDRIEGVPPAIAIDQTNPVRTSRSTVGTMTELNDHLKLLFARLADLYCKGCGAKVQQDTAASIAARLRALDQETRIAVTFAVQVPENFSEPEIEQHLAVQGYTKVFARRQITVVHEAASKGKAGKKKATTETVQVLDVLVDRFRLSSADQQRLLEALEAGLRLGHGKLDLHILDEDAQARETHRYSSTFHCANCDIDYSQPTPSHFSFNSPIGACDTCRGFGRVIGIDFGLVIPDANKTLRQGAVKVFQTAAWKECQDDLIRHGEKEGVPLDTPWHKLSEEHKAWVLEGSTLWKGKWEQEYFGVRRFFGYLESKAYKMHIRVLLSKYRAYTPCDVCKGERLKGDVLLWRVGSSADVTQALAGSDYKHYKPVAARFSDAILQSLPGLNLHDLMLLPIDRLRRFFDGLRIAGNADEAGELVLEEVRARLKYLCDVGLGYLTLDRQSRTLSGGEVQRINLTTALGTSLTGTLFVLDEPSIGLHPRDMDRIIGVMQRLRDAGNSLVVVEHDPQVMFAADKLLDIGPGPGERGGNIVFWGEAKHVIHADTLTAAYLRGEKRADSGPGSRPPRVLPSGSIAGPKLLIQRAREHNLKNVDIELPLHHFVVITGVSGSGKSTLMDEVLHRALLRAKGKPTEAPGACDAVLGAEQIDDIVFVDQSPIGKTARSNPVSYVGGWDAVRNRFAALAESKQRGYTAGTFSFNSGDGRCPTCGGTGFEHIEMQFLSDVYLRCADCDGTRFRNEVREVKLTGFGKQYSISDVLNLTVSEALAVFEGDAEIKRVLQPLSDVGLEYVKLGQPVPTLSGGESQRLKLAGFLAEVVQKKNVVSRGTLYLFDEPTTGLHFDDIAKLLRAFRKLMDAGHSLMVIEHNLDVIRAADWLIDLGPEGGDGGGQIVAVGTPQQVMGNIASHTGKALAQYEKQLGQSGGFKLEEPRASYRVDAVDHGKPLQIQIRKAREHNLKNIDVDIPRNTFTVITGPSGSGKSTLAFDILFNEGQRRYLESLNAYARSIVQPAGKPDVDAIYGIPPTVAIEQRVSRGGKKSTVATVTELHHFLRLMFVKLGVQYCPNDGTAIVPQTLDAMAKQIMADYAGEHIGVFAPLVLARKGYYTDLAKWAAGKGYTHLRVDGSFFPTARWPRLDRFKEHTIELPVADLIVGANTEAQLRDALAKALEYGKGVVHVANGLRRLTDALNRGDPLGVTAKLEVRVFSVKRACPTCGTSYAELDPRMFSYNSKLGWCTSCQGTGLLAAVHAEKTDDEGGRERTFTESEVSADAYETEICDACNGQRLNPVSLNVRLRDTNLAQIGAMSVEEATSFFSKFKPNHREAEISRDALAEIRGRLSFLHEVGLSYLTLDRAAPTLSGGEAQRIRLAAQLGSNLQGVCYVLDEPTIGLHPRDNRVLLDALSNLESKGNTLVVVEHDEDTIHRAQHVIDIGPGSGVRGGRIMAQGTVAELMAHDDSITGRYLKKPLAHPMYAPRKPDAARMLQVKGADLHNLQKVDVSVPLDCLSVVTGVSGSGKSTLARDVLLANLYERVLADAKRATRGSKTAWHSCASIEGAALVSRVLEVDQTPIGKTPRSCPATYIGFWDTIRKLFADTFDARARGFEASRFSFNAGQGRCEVCDGQGMRTIEMNFLPDVKVLCDACGGKRFNAATLEVQLRGKNIGEVLNMNVDDAVEFFATSPSISHPLKLMQDVGLGYLTLGQPSPTLSGGEAQRIKLVTELAKARTDKTGFMKAVQHTLYVLDEPTVGLHMADVEKLIHVLHRLVEAGNSVVVIEHNLDIMAEADWLIDMGPEGGSGGGKVVVQGPLAKVLQHKTSHTGRILREFLAQPGRSAVNRV